MIAIENFPEILNEHLRKEYIPNFQDVVGKLNLPLSERLEFLDLFQQTIELKKWQATLTSDFEELIIHNHQNIFIKKGSQYNRLQCDLDQNDIELLKRIVCIKEKQSLNYKTPFLSFTTEIFDCKFRMTLCHEAINSDDNQKIYIRKQSARSFNLSDYETTKETSDFLTKIIRDKKNIVIAGSTGSGKTSFIQSLFEFCNPQEHLIILEDTTELNSPHPHCTRLCAKDNKDSLAKYLSYCLRMSPDRLILGELRSHEIVPFILAINTGHKGLLTTIHANSAKDAITRLALLFELYSDSHIKYETVLQLICENIDHIVYLENKKVVEVIDVLRSQGDQFYFNKSPTK